MTSKKKTVSKALPFNKKNTLAFADFLYSDKGGKVSFVKLCGDELSNGKDGGRTLHCAVGEAYYTFVNKDMRKVLSLKNDDRILKEPDDYTGAPTVGAIAALADVACLKNPGSKSALVNALNDAVSMNDAAGGDSEAQIFCDRSEAVADIFRTKVAPLLK